MKYVYILSSSDGLMEVHSAGYRAIHRAIDYITGITASNYIRLRYQVFQAQLSSNGWVQISEDQNTIVEIHKMPINSRP